MNETSLKERLKVIALEKESTLHKIWKQLLLERFLIRVSSSKYQDNFIFKGGLLLAKYITIYRETIDIDFLVTKINGDAQRLEDLIKEIIAIDLEDGFSFTWSSIKELSQPHMEYTGFRISLQAKFGKMQDTIHVDVGIGDTVDPVEMTFDLFKYKGKPIFPDEISLLVYPPETIFAEKLETIISKGSANSRMKDYHDLIIMIRELNFIDAERLNEVIDATFKCRGTLIVLPIQLDNRDTKSLQAYWRAHLKGLGEYRAHVNLPDQIEDVISEINEWIRSNLVV